MRISVLFRKWHKWLALVVGVQLLFWTVSGFFMSFVPIENVRSEHLSKKPTLQVLSGGGSYVPIEKVLDSFEKRYSVIRVTLKTLIDDPVYEILASDNTVHLVDAYSGKTITPLKKEDVIEIAKAHFKGDTDQVTASLIKESVIEYRGEYPVWRVDFNNFENTSYYISPENGQVTAKRGTLWRVYDFLWMLHIMDYEKRSDFNNWFLIIAAFLALTTTVSGLVLIRYSFRKRDFTQVFKIRKKHKKD